MSGEHVLDIPGYDEVEEIGRGGFGVVYRARQRDLDRTVAVKVLTDAVDARSIARFDRERRTLGALADHPNVVTIFESGTTRQGQPYLTMEHLAGGSLGDLLARVGRIDWRAAVAAVVAVCGAVETAHRIGVLHRDIKPDNILLDRRGEVVLADFGIAGHVGGTATATGSVTASVGHAPPEVLTGARSTPVADVYSLGSTLFALLAGGPAFVRPTDESVLPVVVRVATEPVPDLRPLGVPDDVASVVERAMAKEGGDRHPSAAALGAALQEAQQRHVVAVTPMIVEAIAVEVPAALLTTVDLVGRADDGDGRPAGSPSDDDGDGDPGDERRREVAAAPFLLPVLVHGRGRGTGPAPLDPDPVALAKSGGRIEAPARPEPVTKAARRTARSRPVAAKGGDGGRQRAGKAGARTRFARRTQLLVGTGIVAIVAVGAVAVANGGDDDPEAGAIIVAVETDARRTSPQASRRASRRSPRSRASPPRRRRRARRPRPRRR